MAAQNSGALASYDGLILGGDLTVLQVPISDALSVDPFSSLDDGLGAAKVGIGGCHIAQALAVTLVIAMLDERFDLPFQIAGQEVVFEQDPAL
jgi:hypothetical protein